MRKTVFLTALALCAVPAAAEAPLGVFFRWAAFEQSKPRRCYAIAAPAPPSARPGGQPHASVGLWPEQRRGPQIYLRLAAARRAGSAVILRIDGRIFQLAGSGADAWAPSPAADAAIIAAMRTGVNMAVESRSESGARIRNRYVLRGAASAIDAAAFACAPGPSGSAGKKPR